MAVALSKRGRRVMWVAFLNLVYLLILLVISSQPQNSERSSAVEKRTSNVTSASVTDGGSRSHPPQNNREKTPQPLLSLLSAMTEIEPLNVNGDGKIHSPTSSQGLPPKRTHPPLTSVITARENVAERHITSFTGTLMAGEMMDGRQGRADVRNLKTASLVTVLMTNEITNRKKEDNMRKPNVTGSVSTIELTKTTSQRITLQSTLEEGGRQNELLKDKPSTPHITKRPPLLQTSHHMSLMQGKEITPPSVTLEFTSTQNKTDSFLSSSSSLHPSRSSLSSPPPNRTPDIPVSSLRLFHPTTSPSLLSSLLLNPTTDLPFSPLPLLSSKTLPRKLSLLAPNAMTDLPSSPFPLHLPMTLSTHLSSPVPETELPLSFLPVFYSSTSPTPLSSLPLNLSPAQNTNTSHPTLEAPESEPLKREINTDPQRLSEHTEGPRQPQTSPSPVTFSSWETVTPENQASGHLHLDITLNATGVTLEVDGVQVRKPI